MDRQDFSFIQDDDSRNFSLKWPLKNCFKKKFSIISFLKTKKNILTYNLLPANVIDFLEQQQQQQRQNHGQDKLNKNDVNHCFY